MLNLDDDDKTDNEFVDIDLDHGLLGPHTGTELVRPPEEVDLLRCNIYVPATTSERPVVAG